MTRNSWCLAIALTAGLSANGCATVHEWTGKDAQTVNLNVSGDVPGAQGKVKVTPESNGNRKVEVTVEHLSPPERLPEGASAYVVWLKPTGSEHPQNMGVLPVDKDLEGKLTFSTAHPDFQVFVTPEPRADVASPTKKEVLQAFVSGQRTIQ
jgi:hypothetical protein